MRNTINNILILYGDSNYTSCDWFTMYANVESIYCTHETDIILSSILKLKKKVQNFRTAATEGQTKHGALLGAGSYISIQLHAHEIGPAGDSDLQKDKDQA